MDDIVQRYLDMESNGIGNYFDADEIIELLEYFEDMEDYDHFTNVVKIGQKLHPHNIDIKIQVCKGNIYNHDFEKALSSIEQLNDTENQDLKVMKCECLCALDRYEELLACLETMKTVSDNEMEETYEYLAHILREHHESKHAYDFVKRGLVMFPDNVRLKEELCYHLDMQYETEKSIAVCKELIDSDPYSVDYWYILGRLYAISEDYDKAIDAFNFALVCDDADLEIKILRAFCFFLKEDFLKVAEIYKEFFLDETNSIIDYIQPLMNFSDQSEQAYRLIKKMIEKYDNFDTESLPRFLLDDRDDEVNGLLSIADSFPCSLLFLLFNELLPVTENDKDAINNIEQIIQLIYQNGTNNINFRIDTTKTFHLSSKQKIKKILAQHTSDIESGDDNECIERQIIQHLLDGNINLFCQQYVQSSSEAISAYLGKLFSVSKKRKKPSAFYLDANEIYRDDYNNISSSELSAKFMTNKNLHN